MKTVKDALNFYRRHLPKLQTSMVSIPQTTAGSWNEPEGCQIHLRQTPELTLVLFHTFANAPQSIGCEIPEKMEICDTFLACGVTAKSDGNRLIVNGLRDFTGGAVLLKHP